MTNDDVHTPRRVFVSSGEIPSLLLAALRGSPAGLRRILGARRTGRIGILLALGALLAGAHGAKGGALLLSTHIALSAVLGHLTGRRRGLTPLTHQRLLLWFVGPLGLVAAPLGFVISPPWLPGLTAISIGHVLLSIYLLRSDPFGHSFVETT